MTLEAYEKKMEKMSPGDYRRELLNQIHVSAKISVKKHENFNDAVLLFVAAVALFVFAFFLPKKYFAAFKNNNYSRYYNG